MMIDIPWFKAQQRRAGIRTEDIARIAGRSRTAVSNIYAGRQRMTLDWAKAFSEALSVPLDEVLRRAGEVGSDDDATGSTLPVATDGDAAPLGRGTRGQYDQNAVEIAKALGAGPGAELWQVRRGAMSLQGLLPGDVMAVDPGAAQSARSGDIVLADMHDRTVGEGPTVVLRRLEPPVLVAASVDPFDRRALVVDGVNVVLRGKVVASWRVPH